MKQQILEARISEASVLVKEGKFSIEFYLMMANAGREAEASHHLVKGLNSLAAAIEALNPEKAHV